MRKLFQSKADANGRYRGENGSYNAATNTIRLDVNAGAYNAGELSQVTLLRTMSHELTHALQQNSPAQYEALKHAVLDVLTSKSGASIEEMAARKMEQDSSLKKADVALDEVVAEACENMLRDSDAMEQLIAQHPAEAKTFLEKMKQFFTDIVNAIRAAFGGSGTSRSREATALMRQAEEYLDICEKWSKALQETAEVSGRMDRQTGDGDVQYSLRDETYLAAVEDGDMQKAQAMVDEAARQAGYTRKLYHGTQYQFNQFMRGGEGIHLGTFEAADFVRRTRASGENQGRMIEAYVRLDNPMYVPYDIQRWDVENLRDLIFAANGLQTSKELLATTADGRQIDLDFSQVEGIPQITKKAPRPARNIQADEDFGTSRRKSRRGAAVQTERATTTETNRVLSDEEQLSRMKTFDEIAEWLKARGIDGIEYTNAIEDKNSTSVLVFDSNQVKLADAVTYDDQGDVIPLSERFDKGNEDIRYSLRETDDGRKVAVVDNDILQDIYDGRWTREKEKQAKAAARNALKKFNRVYVNNIETAVNSDTRREFGGSRYSKALWDRNKKAFADKMRFADVMDDVVTATVGWKNDGILIHDRTDKFVDFVKGDVLLASGDTKYSARVVVGVTRGGNYVLYDITSMEPAAFEYKKVDSHPNYIRDNPRQSVIGESTNVSIAPSDGSVKFSLRENVEQTKDLVAVHNLTEKKLLDALKLGGFPMPSIAVTKSSIGHNTFGNISLVFGRETIDPKTSRKNKVYSADAWTPTFPRIEYEADTRAVRRVDARIRELTNKIPADYQGYMYQYGDLTDMLNRYGGKDGIVEKALSDSSMRAAYVADMGGDVTMEKKNVTVSGVSDAMADKYMRTLALFNYDVDKMMHMPLAQLKDVHGLGEIWSEQTTRNATRLSRVISKAAAYMRGELGTKTVESNDVSATNAKIDRQIDEAKYKAWLEELFNGVEGKSGVYNHKERYTPSGNLRSFDALHYPVSVENIALAMSKENGGDSKNVSGFHGAKTLRAATAETFRSVDEMHKKSNRLQALTQEQIDAQSSALNKRLYAVIDEVLDGSNITGNRFMDSDIVGENLTEIAEKPYSAATIRSTFGQYQFNVSEETAGKIKNLLDDIAQMPVNMFEAKPQRAVYFDEVKYAVVPDNLNPEVLSRLEALVPDVRTYADGDEAQRLELLNQRQDLRFQLRDEDGDAQGLVGIFDETPRLGEAHIDQRSWESMSDRRVHSFMNDYPASRMWLTRMASILQSDVTASTAGQRFMNEEGTFMGQKRGTTPLLAEMKDSGYTWQQMADVFGKMAEVFENGDLEGKVPETAIWKRAELILDRAVTEGYTDMNGIEYRPDAGYMRYKDELPGAKAREIPANAVEDTFEDVDNRLAGGENAAVQTGSDGERVQLQGDTAYQEKQRSAKSGIPLMDGGPSNRKLLSEALESAAQTPEELRYVQSYKKQAQKIAEMEGLLVERRAEVQQLQDMKSRTADQEIRMKNLQQSIAETESMIDKRDKGLLKMEAMEPLRNVLDRERANYRETLKQAKKDAAARQREKDAAKLDNALLATQMHEGREWAAKLHEAENRVAEANQKVEDLKAQSLADRMHESSEWAAKLRKAEGTVKSYAQIQQRHL